MRHLQTLRRAKRVNRESFLVALAQGKKVLHVGCVDAGLLDDRLANDSWLHTKLEGTSVELWGLDSDTEGVRRLKGAGFQHVIAGSAESPPKEIPREYFDLVVAGEVIEHVRNPGLFLDAAARLVAPGGVLVITTPNALRFYNPVTALLGRELIHPEHLSWYSPYTLRSAVEAGPFVVENLYVYTSIPLARLKGVVNPIKWSARVAYNIGVSAAHSVLVTLFPHVSDGLILVGRPSIRR